jgi:uncharacterized membrane protein YozB (DUF420 family)
VTVRDLPLLNAVLNGTAGLLIATGWILIRRGQRQAHKRVMLAAVACSAIFLVSYLTYHYHVGSVRFQGQGPIRTVYFAILISHTILAVVIVPLVLISVNHGLRERFDRHRRIARIALPLWAYVSVTGVVIYWMLYRM